MSDFEEYASGLKVVELKEELKKRNLNTSGNKAALVQRLIDYEKAEVGQSAVEKPEEVDGEEKRPDEMPAEEANVKGEEEKEKAGEPEVVNEEKLAEPQTENNEVKEEEQSEEKTEAVLEGAEGKPGPVLLSPDESSAETQERSAETQERSAETQELSAETQELSAETQESSAETQERSAETQERSAETQERSPETQERSAETQERSAERTDAKDVEKSSEEQQADEGWVLIDKTDTENAEQNAATENEKVEAMEADSQQEKVEQVGESSEASPVKGEALNGATDNQVDEAHGTKRRNDDVSGDGGGATKDKVDPTKVPDPDEPEAVEELTSNLPVEDEFERTDDDNVVTLDSYHCDLHFKIRKDGLGGCGLTESGFANMWAGARATRGVKGGKYFYECKVEQDIPVNLPETEPHPNVLRVGWTVDDAGLDLGEGPHSYGYGGTGKTVENNNYQTYGEPFGPGDVIGCYVDLESSPGVISFSKNGTHFGPAFTLPHGLSGVTLYPIVYTKNVLLSVNFDEPALFPPPEGYVPIQKAAEGHWVPAQKSPASKADCEVIMLVGLPGCGKTFWAEKHSLSNPGKWYNILGTNAIMDKMKVSGLGKKENYNTRWSLLIKDATAMLEKVFVLASRKPRNYIIDQTNVYASAQRRKMSHFAGFKRKAVVVIPPHHELRRRAALRAKEMGKMIPDEAVNAMKANFSIPAVGPLFDEVVYTDIYGNAAEKIVRQYKDDAMGLPSFPVKRPRFDARGGGGGGGRYGAPPQRDYGGPPPNFRPYGNYAPYGRPYYPPYGPPAPPPPPPPHMYGGPPRGGGGYRGRPPYGRPQYDYGPPRGRYYGGRY